MTPHLFCCILKMFVVAAWVGVAKGLEAKMAHAANIKIGGGKCLKM